MIIYSAGCILLQYQGLVSGFAQNKLIEPGLGAPSWNLPWAKDFLSVGTKHSFQMPEK